METKHDKLRKILSVILRDNEEIGKLNTDDNLIPDEVFSDVLIVEIYIYEQDNYFLWQLLSY